MHIYTIILLIHTLTLFLGTSFIGCNEADFQEFAVEMDMDKLEAEIDLNEYSIKVLRKIHKLGNVYHVRRHLLKYKNSTGSHKRSKREINSGLSAKEIEEVLRKHPLIKRVELQYDLQVEQKAIGYNSYSFNDQDSSSDIQKKLFEQLSDDSEKNMDQFMELQKKDDFTEQNTNQQSKEKYSSEQMTMSQEDRDYNKLVEERSKNHSSLKFNDPQAWRLWQYNNNGQFHHVSPGLDMNIYHVYQSGYSGRGVVATVIDDGLDTRHKEIKQNYDPVASLDMNDPFNERASPRGPPYRRQMPLVEGHGTSCGSLIAGVANNKFCGHGVAFNANIGGIRMLSRNMVTDLLEAYALTHNNEYIQIFSNSWGPKDSGAKTAPTTYYVEKALEAGISQGRNGLGNIFLFASGNGGLNYDHCGADGLVNSPYTISVTAINIFGMKPAYTEECAAITITAAVGGYGYSQMNGQASIDPVLIAAQVNNRCIKRFLGTSAATPLISGCLALSLEANNNLSWRDIYHLLSVSGRIPNNREAVWQRNGAGILVSHYYGFGLLDCSLLVRNSQLWKNVGPSNSCIGGSANKHNLVIRSGERTRITFETSACLDSKLQIDRLEHVMLHTKIDHVCRGDLAIMMTSPTGTRSFLLKHRRRDTHAGTIKFSHLSLMHWNENPRGSWVVEIADLGTCGNYRHKNTQRGTVLEMTLEFRGTKLGDDPVTKNPDIFDMYSKNSGLKQPDSDFKSDRVLSESQLNKAYQTQRFSYIVVRPLDRRSNNLRKDIELERTKKTLPKMKFEEHFQQQIEELRSDVPRDDIDYLQYLINNKTRLKA